MALEPVAGQVYFSPEATPPTRRSGSTQPRAPRAGGVALPDGPAYFASRGSLLGQVPGEVVAAAFARVQPGRGGAGGAVGLDQGGCRDDLRRADPGRRGPARCACWARAPDGLGRATELLARAVEPLRPEGKPLFAGLWPRSARRPDGRHVAAGRHSCASTAATRTSRRGPQPASTPPRSGLLTELYWGLPLRTYIRTRAWSDAELDAAEGRLVARGLLVDGALTSEGPGRPRVRRGGDRCPVRRHARRAR